MVSSLILSAALAVNAQTACGSGRCGVRPVRRAATATARVATAPVRLLRRGCRGGCR